MQLDGSAVPFNPCAKHVRIVIGDRAVVVRTEDYPISPRFAVAANAVTATRDARDDECVEFVTRRWINDQDTDAFQRLMRDAHDDAAHASLPSTTVRRLRRLIESPDVHLVYVNPAIYITSDPCGGFAAHTWLDVRAGERITQFDSHHVHECVRDMYDTAREDVAGAPPRAPYADGFLWIAGRYAFSNHACIRTPLSYARKSDDEWVIARDLSCPVLFCNEPSVHDVCNCIFYEADDVVVVARAVFDTLFRRRWARGRYRVWNARRTSHVHFFGRVVVPAGVSRYTCDMDTRTFRVQAIDETYVRLADARDDVRDDAHAHADASLALPMLVSVRRVHHLHPLEVCYQQCSVPKQDADDIALLVTQGGVCLLDAVAATTVAVSARSHVTIHALPISLCVSIYDTFERPLGPLARTCVSPTYGNGFVLVKDDDALCTFSPNRIDAWNDKRDAGALIGHPACMASFVGSFGCERSGVVTVHGADDGVQTLCVFTFDGTFRPDESKTITVPTSAVKNAHVLRDASAVALLSTDALCVARWTNGGWAFVTIDVVPREGVDVLHRVARFAPVERPRRAPDCTMGERRAPERFQAVGRSTGTLRPDRDTIWDEG